MRPRQPVTSVSSRGDWAPCNGDGNPFCNQAPSDCRDSLDYSLCAFLANSGQCALMNGLAEFGIYVPCPATCGSCKYSLSLDYDIKFTFIITMNGFWSMDFMAFPSFTYRLWRFKLSSLLAGADNYLAFLSYMVKSVQVVLLRLLVPDCYWALV